MLPRAEVRDNFSKHGCGELKTARCQHYDTETDSSRAGYGDDFVAEAAFDELGVFDEIMASSFKVKPQPRAGPKGAAEVAFLNRTAL